jgi:RimJ/RimL family protein N-acetyltransferase
MVKDVQIETERLLLRMIRLEDFEAYAALGADPEVMRYLGGKTWDRLESWRHMCGMVGHWHFRGYGIWAVEEKSTGQFIGRIGLHYPETWPGFELGWTLARAAQGKGYATEAARRALEYAFVDLNRDHLISLINPDNHASIRVAERIGEKVEGRTQLLGTEVLVYGIDRDAWQAQQAEV